jgi:hypothetical protein
MSLSVSRYSEKAIAVFGNSKPYYGNLNQLGGGKWAEHITNKDTGVKGGWIFYNAKEKELRELIDKINKKQVEPIGKEEVVQEEKKTLSRSNESSKLLSTKSNSFDFTKEMYLAMKSEIERLTNDVSVLLSYIEKKPDNPFISTPQKKLVVKVPQAPLKKQIQRKEESEEEKSDSEEEESDNEQAGIPKKSFLF